MFQSASARHCRLTRLSGHHWSDFPEPYITGPFLLEEQQKHLRRLRTRSHMRSELIQAADCRHTTPLHFSFFSSFPMLTCVPLSHSPFPLSLRFASQPTYLELLSILGARCWPRTGCNVWNTSRVGAPLRQDVFWLERSGKWV